VRTAVRMPPTMDASSGWGGSASYGAGIPPRFVFLQFDIYDIVIAERALGAAEVLQEIQPAKRPHINHDVFAALDDLYRSPVAFCCFRSVDDGEAKPLAFSFEPLYPQTMCVYTLDGHDGKPPSLDDMVNLNHTIFVGSYLAPKEKCARIAYRDAIPDHLAPYLLDYAMGMPVNGMSANGDFVFATEDVRNGIFKGLRQNPPFAQHGTNGVYLLTREEEYLEYAR
jgi:hypothetical protein